MQTTCADHNGHSPAYMQQRDGAKWVKISDWIEPMKDKVQPLLKKAAADYIQKNTGWPKRTEACDKSSRRRHQGYHFIRRPEVQHLSPNELVRRGCIQVMEGRRCFGHLTIEENLLTGALTRRDG